MNSHTPSPTDPAPAEGTGTPRRGKLKIYLGAAPGVGKTCAMLNEAKNLHSAGIDVVVGIVEDHGRSYTRSLCEGLPIMARLAGPGAGELDVEGVIARHPKVALIDEFAHTNDAGAVRRKRWQDVSELLDAGIDVISTMNIQHLESLNDVVSQITGITQKETVPDEVVRDADTIELVDISPEFLRTRLSEGHVYGEERIGPALNNYFRLGNLTALRELALLWLADQVDDALSSYRTEQNITEPWETKERVIVAVENAAHAEPLIRRGRRIASKSSADLVVVHVISGDTFVTGSSDTLARLGELSKDVGAKLHQVTGDSVPEALLNFARSMNATQLVLGVAPNRRHSRVLRGSVAEAVLKKSGKIDCHIVNIPSKQRGRVRELFHPAQTGWARAAVRWGASLAGLAATTGLVRLAGGEELGTGTCSAFYFALILAVSLFFGLWPAVVVAIGSGLALNWFFTDPLYTFDIAEPANTFILVVMVAIALAVGILVRRAEVDRRTAVAATRDAELLTVFSREALGRNGRESVDSLLGKVGEAFGSTRATLVDSVGIELSHWDSPSARAGLPKPAGEVETSVLSHDESVGLTLSGPVLTARDRDLIQVVADYLAGLNRQVHLAAEAARADAIAAADDLRRSLLASVSHDLRTPLSTAKLALSSLLSTEVTFREEDQVALLEETAASVDQLITLVTNLLDSSRLAAGAVTARREQVDLSEVVHRAVASCSFGRDRSILQRVAVHSSVRGVQCVADSALLERVVANLLDNALRYAPSGSVDVTARAHGKAVELRVSDHGPGVPVAQKETMFRPFQRLGDTNNDAGVGLGLSVVRGFVEAMHGTVAVEDGPGTTVVVTLEGSE